MVNGFIRLVELFEAGGAGRFFIGFIIWLAVMAIVGLIAQAVSSIRLFSNIHNTYPMPQSKDRSEE